MAGLYFYVPRAKIKDIVDCGLKLSEWYDREILLPGQRERSRAIRMLMNPRDDADKMKNPNYQCLRLEVNLDYCTVGEAALYQMGLKEPHLMECYLKGLIPFSEYRFGTFRNPEVLVMTSVLPECIEVMGKAMDIPILYENSTTLYLNNIIEKHEETYKDSGNHLLYAHYALLESLGRVKRFEDQEKGYVIFFNNDSSGYIVLRIPEEAKSIDP
jgi:hypothetical protein